MTRFWTPLFWLLLAGCSQESSSGPLCEQSGGAWKEVSDCPSICAPPPPSAEACATIEEMQCATVCGEAPVCSCPSDKPFWQDGEGCVGFDECPDPDTGD